MKKLLNYSHPLSDLAREQLRERVGDFEEIIINTQIDFDQPIKPQLDALVEAAPARYEYDLYIPPALSFAAAYVTARLSCEYGPPAPPPMVVLKRDPESVAVRFIVAEIIGGYEYEDEEETP